LVITCTVYFDVRQRLIWAMVWFSGLFGGLGSKPMLSIPVKTFPYTLDQGYAYSGVALRQGNQICVTWPLIFVRVQCGTCFLSPVWCSEC